MGLVTKEKPVYYRLNKKLKELKSEYTLIPSEELKEISNKLDAIKKKEIKGKYFVVQFYNVSFMIAIFITIICIFYKYV